MTNSIKQLSLLALILCAGFFSGCSGIKPYPNNLDKNLYITTTTAILDGHLAAKTKPIL